MVEATSETPQFRQKWSESHNVDVEAWRILYLRKERPKEVKNGTSVNTLSKVKVDPESTNFGDKVSCIRPSQKAKLIMELTKCRDVTAGKFLSQIGIPLGHETDIRAGKPEITIVYMDIDEITTKQEVFEDLEKQFDLNELQESAVKTLREAYGKYKPPLSVYQRKQNSNCW